MIHEFALDPEAISNWQNFRYIVERFGVSQGRLISRFPAKWKLMVHRACADRPDREKKQIEVALEEIDEKMIRLNRTYDHQREWIPNAVHSHGERPFHAIITTLEKLGPNGPLLDVEQLSENKARWNVPRGAKVPRTPMDLAHAAKTLLEGSAEVLLIDPHFSGVARYGQPLKNFIAHACSGIPLRRFEYHLGNSGGLPDHFRAALQKQLRHLALPASAKLVFVRWCSVPNGPQLHARYILTESGGIRFDHGLDSGDEGETTDVECIDDEIYRETWQQFHPDSGVFRVLDAWIMTHNGVVQAEWRDGKFLECA